MSKNFKVNKSVLNFIHARQFWPEGDAPKLSKIAEHLKWDPKKYGYEIPHFNLIDPELELVVGEMLGDWVKIHEEESGVFRVPYPIIHFEDFNTLGDWRCAVALEDNIFKTYRHIDGTQDARYGYENFNYSNPDEWIVESQINLKQNDCVFYRPWVFHSFLELPLYCFKATVQDED